MAPVITTLQFLRVNMFEVIQGASNLGVITLSSVTGTIPLSYISRTIDNTRGIGRSWTGVYTTPRGWDLYINFVKMNNSSIPSSTYIDTLIYAGSKSVISITAQNTGPFFFDANFVKVPEMTDINIMGVKSSNPAEQLRITIDGTLIRNV